eukprot:snap_masked-scaffold_1-processed-gene-31.11-mRNA-1 protein AED:0.01 eAED:0.01 QI:116/1/1/1/1/1/2/92/428
MPSSRGSSPRMTATTPTNVLGGNLNIGKSGAPSSFTPYLLPGGSHTHSNRPFSPTQFYPINQVNHNLGWNRQMYGGLAGKSSFRPNLSSTSAGGGGTTFSATTTSTLNPKSQVFYPINFTGPRLGAPGAKDFSVRSSAAKLTKPQLSELYRTSDGMRIEIRNVWKNNLEEEMKHIRSIVRKYRFIAMDTEFPGTVAKPVVNASNVSASEYSYQTVRANVDLLKLIQLGVAFADEEGNFAKLPGSSDDLHSCCWQFHFKFSLSEDIYAQDSIDLLKRSGINFDLHEVEGISVSDFGELLVTSGMVLLKDVHWITFHGSYDFAYLLKILITIGLPESEENFKERLCKYFHNFHDVKKMMSEVGHLTVGGVFVGGLKDVAEYVSVERIGPEHQAGSDSLLTLESFFKLRELHFKTEDGTLVGAASNDVFMA